MTAGTANSKDWKVPTFAERPSNGHFWEGMAGVEGLEPQPPVLEFGNSDDIVYYFVLIRPKNQPLSSLGGRLDAVQFGPVLSSW